MIKSKSTTDVAVELLHTKFDRYLCDYKPVNEPKLENEESLSELKERLLEQLKKLSDK